MADNKKAVLKLLQENCRYKNSQIASMTGLSEDEVEKIILELEEEGVIVKYSAIINPEKLNENGVEALIQVQVKPQKLKGFDAFAEQLSKFKEVKSVYLISGGFDLAVVIYAKDLASVARFVYEKLSVVDGIVNVSSHFILKKYKIEGQEIFSSNDNQRQIVL